MRNDAMLEHYKRCDSDKRLEDRIGLIEFNTTMDYIHKYFYKGAKILEIGACTGAYSIPLSREGYQVTAVELFQYNIDILKAQLTKKDTLQVYQGNAVDLSFLKDNEFDGVLILGPLYHLEKEDRLLAISEAKRVCKKEGYIFNAYCLRDCQIMTLGFHEEFLYIKEWIKQKKIDKAFNFVDKSDVFKYCSFQDIDEINLTHNLKRIEIIGTDTFCYYVKRQIEHWDDDTYNNFVEYHKQIRDNPYFIGATNHVLDIVQIIK